jgi:hypothetical protein
MVAGGDAERYGMVLGRLARAPLAALLPSRP